MAGILQCFLLVVSMFHTSTPDRFLLSLVLAAQFAICSDTTPVTGDILAKTKQLIQERKYEEAGALLERTRASASAHHDEYTEGLVLDQLGLVYEREGKYLASRQAFDGCVSRIARTKGKDTPELVQPLNNLAHLLYESGQFSQAEALVRRNLGILASNGSGSDTGVEMAILAKIYLGENKASLAEQTAEDSMKILRQYNRQEDIVASLDYTILGAVDNHHNGDSAEESLRHALAILEDKLGPNDYRVGEAMANLGLLYLDRGAAPKGEPLLEQARACFRASSANNLFVRRFLMLWAGFERKGKHNGKAKNLTTEAKALMAVSQEESMSRYVVDANSLR